MRKFLSILLCLCLMISILPVSVFAATEIKVLHAQVTEPAVGQKPGKVTLTGDTRFKVTETKWSGNLNADGTFMAGEVYSVEYKVTFKNYKDVVNYRLVIKEGIDVTLNGYKARIKYKDGIEHATLTYTFPVLTETGVADDPTRDLAGVKDSMSSEIAAKDTDQTFAEEATRIEERIEFTATAPIAGESPVVTAQTSHPDILITSVNWSGTFTPDKKFMAGYNYKLEIAFKIKGDVNKVLQPYAGNRLAAINGEWIHYDINRKNDKEGTLTKSFECKTAKPVVDITKYFSQAQADERWVTVYPMHPTEIIVKEGELLMDICRRYSEEQYNCVKKIVFDYTYASSAVWSDAHCIQRFPNLEELWLGPNVNPKEFFDDYADSRFGLTGDEWIMPYKTRSLDSQKMTAFVPEVNADKLPEEGAYMRFTTKLYSGNLMDAYKKGPSAGYDRCTNHDYSRVIYTPDRTYSMKSCLAAVRYYYSCSKCGKCEYNPNHTTVPRFDMKNLDSHPSDHYITERNLSDRYFLGLNSRGERIYWKSCVMCGKIHNDVLGPSEGATLPNHALEGSYLKDDHVYAFAVRNDRYVNAKMSSWAENDVQWASQNGILDLNLLGNDYTKPITRLQFASVAVKLAETLIGYEISPAPQGTFADTDNEYALKAFASGITSGVSATEFNPNGTLTRQQMAAFIYRALMYVRDNTDIRYTTYTPELEKFTDSRGIADWAKTSMGFMNALGLIKGASATTIDPNGTCTIEQAVAVANRSVNADEIGWYQVPLSNEESLGNIGTPENRFFYAPTDHAPTQTMYYNSTRIWVDIPVSGGQKASENPDNSMSTEFLATFDPYIGSRAYVPKSEFKAIKDFKATDVDDYNKNFIN